MFWRLPGTRREILNAFPLSAEIHWHSRAFAGRCLSTSSSPYCKLGPMVGDDQRRLDVGQRDALEAVRKKVTGNLASSDNYQAAVKAKEDAVQAFRDAPSDISDSERASLAQDEMDARSAVSKLEISALANDPDYQAAKKAAKLTSDTLRSPDQGLRVFLLSDPGYQHAQAAVDQAQGAVTAADGAAVAEAQAKDTEDTNRNNAIRLFR
jgi:hypothetical protein